MVGRRAIWWDFSNFIEVEGATLKILWNGSGDKSS
jgi:hypothetical protein